MEALFNQTSKLASNQLVSKKCPGWLAMTFLFWSYLGHLKKDFDGVKRKVGFVNEFNLRN